jgi:hypothetical protein
LPARSPGPSRSDSGNLATLGFQNYARQLYHDKIRPDEEKYEEGGRWGSTKGIAETEKETAGLMTANFNADSLAVSGVIRRSLAFFVRGMYEIKMPESVNRQYL